jgi:hypothetical protein
MSEAAERVEAWRREKRKAGYRPVLLWLSIETKGALDALAYRRHQDPSSCVADAIHALAAKQGPPQSTRVSLKEVEALLDRKLAEALAGQPLTAPLADAPEEAPLALPQPLTAPRPDAPAAAVPLAAGMKQCGKGHGPYPASKPECLQCVRARNRAYRKRQADQRRGAVPA